MKRLIIFLTMLLCLTAGAVITSEAAEYRCTSEDEIIAALSLAASKEESVIEINCTRDIFGKIKSSGFGLLNVYELKSGILDADIRYSDDGYLEFTNIEYGEMLWEECFSQEDVSAAIRRMGEKEAVEFALILDQDTYKDVSADDFAIERELEARGGMISSSMSYNYRSCILYYSEYQIVPDAKELVSIDEASEYVMECAAKGMTEIAIFCTEGLFDQLMGDAVKTDEETGNERIYDLTVRCGIFEYEISYYSVTHIIIIYVDSYYPGTKIVAAYNDWKKDPTESNLAEAVKDLNGREQETFETALVIAMECTAETPLLTAYNIHDRLCSLVEYTDDRSTDEDDTAIGAILNGKANCDGYADAFYLIGTLAGLEVEYIYGNSINKEEENQDRVNHMWNLLNLNGSWRLVDVTWDDDETGWKYTWFNLGYDKAVRMHIWNTDMYPELLPETDLNGRPENEYHVYTYQEAVIAVNLAEALQLNDFSIVFENEESAAYYNDVLNAVSRRAYTSFSYYWDEIMLELDIIGVSMY